LVEEDEVVHQNQPLNTEPDDFMELSHVLKDSVQIKKMQDK
jgi:hypothetical protein